MLKANAVGSAIPLEGTERRVQLRYLPASFVFGTIISASALCLLLLGAAFCGAKSLSERLIKRGRLRCPRLFCP